MGRKNTTLKAVAIVSSSSSSSLMDKDSDTSTLNKQTSSSSSSSSSLIDKYSDSSSTLKQQLESIDNQLIDLNNQRNVIIERLSFNEINIQNIMQQNTPSLGFLSDELIKIILSYMNAKKQALLLDINKHYRSYKLATCYYNLNKKQSFEYLVNQNGMRDKIENSVANPNKQISLTFSNKPMPDVSLFANLHSLTLNNCTQVRNVSPLAKLSYLDLTGTRGIADISALVNLDTLILSNMKKMSVLPTNLNIKHLTLQGGQLSNIQGLSNCKSLNITGSSFRDCSESNLACLGNVDNLVLTSASIGSIIDGWKNQKLTLSSVQGLTEIKNLRNMENISIDCCRSLKTIEDIDGVEKIDINSCQSLLKLEGVSNIAQLTVRSTLYRWEGDEGLFKEISNVENIDKITLSSLRLFNTITNISNVREIKISSCSSLLDLSPLTHPEANIQVLFLSDLQIVDLNVQGRIPEVTLTRCNSIIVVTGLASCRKLTIEQCSKIVDVSALGLVEHLALEYSPYTFTKKTFQGLAALGRVQDLTLKGIDMASTDLDSYVDVQKLTILNCINISMPLNTLNLLSADREPKSFNINSCKFDAETNIDIQALKISSDLSDLQDRFYFKDNNVPMPVAPVTVVPVVPVVLVVPAPTTA